MKPIYTLFFLVLLFNAGLCAQNFSGTAHYVSAVEFEVSIGDSSDENMVNRDQNAMIQKLLAESMRKEYTLSFTRTRSIYKKEEVLQENSLSFGGMDASSLFGSISDNGVTNFLYKNVESGIVKTEKDFLGKIFLISDSLKPLKWKVENETKKIGNYTCYKALTKRTSQALDHEGYDTTIVTVWYTTDIPVSNGPDKYWGLPGLILEVSDGNTSILCDKLVLSGKETEIKEPQKKKEYTQEEYDKITKDKLEEMSDGKGAITID